MPKKVPTKDQEIADVIEELRLSLIERSKANKAEDNVRVRVQKAQKRLLMAKQALYAVDH